MPETAEISTVQNVQEQGWFFVHPRRGVHACQAFQDTDENWLRFVGNPAVGDKEGYCVRGAQYSAPDDCVDYHDDGTPRATNINVLQVWGVLFDIDDFRKRTDINPPTPQEIVQRLGAHRFIVWTSWSHLTDKDQGGIPSQDPRDVRYKVYIPFSRAMSPIHFPAIFRRLLAASGNLACDAQGDIARLGYLPKRNAANPNVYQAYIHQAPRFDPYEDGIPEVSVSDIINYGLRRVVGTPAEPDKKRWNTREEAIDRARAYFSAAAFDVGEGNRHKHLMQWGCKLWWDFWFDREDVEMILLELNAQFPTPKSAHEVRMEVEATWKRTRGPSAREQVDQEGNPVPAGAKRLPPPPPTPTEWIDVANRLKRASTEDSKAQGRLLLDAIKPQKDGGFKPPEDPESFYLQAAEILGAQAPLASPEELFEVMKPSWEMYGEDHVAEEFCLAEIKRSATAVKEKQEKARSAEESERALLIEEAFLTVGRRRNTPYTIEELSFWASQRGITIPQLKRQLIVKVKGLYHFFIDGSYTVVGFPKDSLVSKARVMLSPVDGFSTKKLNEKGMPIFKTVDEVQNECTTIVARAYLDFNAPASHYATDDTFCIAPVRLNDQAQPRFVPEVDQWLRTFSNYESVKEWLSWYPSLDKPLPMLYLQGPAGSGKTLLSLALSKVWSKFAFINPMLDAVHKFSHAWASCPVFTADEELPHEVVKSSAVFRDMILSNSRKLEKKGQDSMSVRGYARFLLLANNGNQIPEFKDEASEEDIVAVRQRVFHTVLTEASTQFLQNFPGGADRLVNENLLASHVLYLFFNERKMPTGTNNTRFPMVVPGSNALFQVGRSDLKEQVLACLEKELLKSGTTSLVPDSTGTDQARTVLVAREWSGAVYISISIRALKDVWKLHLDTMKDPPSSQRIGKALNNFCVKDYDTGKARTFKGRAKENRCYIQPTKLLEEAEKHDVSAEELADVVRAFFAAEASRDQKVATHINNWG